MLKIACQKWKESSIKRFQAAEQFRLEDKFCDIILQSVDKINVKAHKIVLSSASNYFNNLFSSGMRETFEDCIKYEIIKGDVLEKVISFIYTGQMDIATSEQIEEIAVCANYFQLDDLIDECMKLLSGFLNDNNCLKYWRLGHECFRQEFENECVSYVFNSSNRIYENETFFNQLDNDEVETLMKDDRLDWTEQKKFEELLQWTKQNAKVKEDFNKYFLKFIEFVDFTQINKGFFLLIILNDDHLIEHQDILKIIAAKCKNSIHPPPSMAMEPEKKLLAIIGDELKSISSDGKFSTLQKKENCVDRSADTTFKNFLFICGGRKTIKDYVNCCEIFDPETKIWKTLPSMSTLRREHACTFLEDKIYTCGGWNGKRLSIVEIFDVNQEKWIQGENMKNGRGDFGLVSTNRALYAVSGHPNNKTIEMWDPRTGNSWKELYNDFSCGKYTQCISMDSDIYCFQLMSDKVLIFDTKKNKMREWEGVLYLPVKSKKAFKVCMLNENINFIQVNSRDSTCWDTYNYDLNGDLNSLNKNVYKTDKTCDINAFAALNY